MEGADHLLFSGDAVPEAGAALTLGDPAGNAKDAGYVTRAAQIWDPPRVIGMGYVRKEAEAPGTTLQWAGGSATVVHLPEGRLPEGRERGRQLKS